MLYFCFPVITVTLFIV